MALTLLWCSLLFAQPFPPDSVWTFAFDDGGDEYFYDAVEVEDGYLLCGEAREWGALAGEALLVKIDRAGELVWSRRYPDERFRRLKGVAQDTFHIETFGEYLHADGRSYGLFYGETNSQGQGLFIAPVGYQDGRQHHAVNFGVSFDLNWFTFSYQDTDSTSFAATEFYEVGGYMERDTFAIGSRAYCRDFIGNLQLGYWCGGLTHQNQATNGFAFAVGSATSILREFGGNQEDYFNAVSGVAQFPVPVLAGASFSYTNGSSDLWLQAIEASSLDSLWSRHYGGLSYEDGVEIVNAADSGFIIAGNFSSEDIEFEQSDFWLLRVDENGDSVWSVLSGRDEADRCEGMIETENGFLLFGASQSFAVPGWDGCAMYLGYVPDLAVSPGSLNFGPVQVGDSAVRTVNLVNTGSNVLTVNGFSATDVYHALFSEAATVDIGDTLRVEVVFAPQSGGSIVDTLRIQSDAITGEKILRCLGAGTGVSADDATLPREFALHPPYPNPFNATTTLQYDLVRESDVRLELFDVNGRLTRVLATGTQSAGSHTATLDLHDVSSGIYFAALRAGSDHAVQKLLLVK